MRVLWICNLVLPEFSKEFNINPTCYGGWMSGLLATLRNVEDLHIGCCFPIIDKRRLKSGIVSDVEYFSFHASMDSIEYKHDAAEEFVKIINKFKPDVIQVWGTEYNHARAVVEACLRMNMASKIIVHIQGLLSRCSEHYTCGVSSEYLDMVGEYHHSINFDKQNFVIKGKNEEEIFKNILFVLGRTEWDKECCQIENDKLTYFYCNEVLRKEFYENRNIWQLANIKRHSIFLSQASYPIKGMHFLLKSMPTILEKFPDAQIYIGGNNPLISDENGEIAPYGQYLNSLIDELQIRNKIIFLGNLNENEMIMRYLRAHVFVSPSTIENSSNSICEAMMLGVPVVASYVGGTPDLISHGHNGFLYQADAPYMLAAYVMKVFADDFLADSMAQEARKTAQKRHDRDVIKERMLCVYRIIANKG